jgi:mRNA-degrading endonuclease RelE of RelBE toxin-antitoxin system
MEFRIADTFTDSLARLTGDEQKAVKTTAFDLQLNPANPGMSFHKLDKARDKHFWSVRVSRDIRLIVHRTTQSLLLCFVGHHDDAYHWAECRKIETHPSTGAAQIVEIRERVQEITVPKYVEPEPRGLTSAPLFAAVADGELLGWGVPAEWLPDVRATDSEDGLLTLTDHLPAEAAEALIEFATGGVPQRRMPEAVEALEFSAELQFQQTPERDREAIARSEPRDWHDEVPGPTAFAHPDAQRRFRTIESSAELERALEAPWDKWTIFLHPAQREWVEKDYSGPARVSGSAGTGKTIVALHRAVHLAGQHPDNGFSEAYLP